MSTNEIEALRQKLERREAQIKSLIVENAVNSALNSVAVRDGMRDVVEVMLRAAIKIKDRDGEFKVEMVDKDTGNPLISLKDGQAVDMTPTDFVHELRAKSPVLFKVNAEASDDETLSPLFEKNPFSYEHRNLAEQMRIAKTDPVIADKLRAAAEEALQHSNPWAKQSWNLTRQMVLMNADPKKAAELEAQAKTADNSTSGANPFRAETRNLAEQTRLYKTNPALARQLAAEAGIKLP